MKPAYVTVEFWRDSRDETTTLEGWMTVDGERYFFITPSLDYDPEIVMLSVDWKKVISIIPAASVRKYSSQVASIGDKNTVIVTDAHGGMEEVDLSDGSRRVIGKGKRPILEAFERMGLIDDLGEDEGRPAFYRDTDGNLKAISDG